MKIALILTDSLSNLHQEDIDIRFAQPGNDLLIARRLAPHWRVLCASPEYLARHGIPRIAADLIHHHFIVLATSAGLLNEYHFAIGDDALSDSFSAECLGNE